MPMGIGYGTREIKVAAVFGGAPRRHFLILLP